MITLAINTASSQTEIALLDSSGKLIREKSWLSKNTEAEKLMPEIDSLFTETDHSFDEVSKVICVKGPVSFTGLRVGVTVANTFATLNKCDLFAVDTFEYLWKEKEDFSNTALLVFAGSGAVYVDKNGENSNGAKLVSLEELKSELSNEVEGCHPSFSIRHPELCIRDNEKSSVKISIFGDISDPQKEFLKKEGFIFTERKKTFGKIMEEIFTDIEKGKFKKVKIIEPVYIKKPQITESKNKIFA